LAFLAEKAEKETKLKEESNRLERERQEMEKEKQTNLCINRMTC
jgi:hypothetical protein